MFYLMRHAKPDYSHLHGEDPMCFAFLAPLLEESRQYIKELKTDINIDLIVSSPFTRALETAYLMSEKLGKDIIVEPLLHEWLPNRDCIGNITQILIENHNYLANLPGTHETIYEYKTRLETVFDKYKDKNVLFVGHARLFSSILGYEMRFAQIVPLNYDKS